MCDEPCTLQVGDGQTPPWRCAHCRRAWWDAELTDEARAAYNKHTDDFHWTSGVRDARDGERQLTHLRGVSVAPEHLEHLHPSQREIVKQFSHPRAVEFREM